MLYNKPITTRDTNMKSYVIFNAAINLYLVQADVNGQNILTTDNALLARSFDTSRKATSTMKAINTKTQTIVDFYGGTWDEYRAATHRKPVVAPDLKVVEISAPTITIL